MKYLFFLLLSATLLISCGKSNDSLEPEPEPEPETEPEPEPVLSTGLKIFVTAEKHVGDFLNNPTLNGTTAIQKADDFCNKSANKPNNSSYKALLVDGINRDAVSLTDWVLEASTDYYRPYDNIKIGTTSNTHILNAFWSELDNTISECNESCAGSMDFYVWTGIDNAGDFSTQGNTCDSWSNSSYPPTGRYGIYIAKDGYAISSNIFGACSQLAYLYCVEQP